MQPFVDIGAESFVSNASTLKSLLFEKKHLLCDVGVCQLCWTKYNQFFTKLDSRHYSLICSSCLWKCGFFQHSQLSECTRNRGRTKLRFKDIVRGNLQKKRYILQAVVLSCRCKTNLERNYCKLSKHYPSSRKVVLHTEKNIVPSFNPLERHHLHPNRPLIV